MFDRIRDMALATLQIIAERIGLDPARVTSDRVTQSPRTLAGVHVTPDSAVTVPAVWACLRYLSQTVAVLPWHVMHDGRDGAEVMRLHPIDWLLWKRANPEWSSFQFRETLTHWALRWGNGYAEIEPDQVGRPFALWPIHPERVTCCRAISDEYSSAGDELLRGDLYYEINNGADGKVTIASKRMFHLRGFGEGPVGVNVIAIAAQSIGWAKATQIFGATFFGNGMNPSGILINKKPLKPEGLKRQRAELEQLHGGVYRSNKIMVTDADATWNPTTTEPQKAQMVEVQQHQVEEICRWFGVPPHKVMHLLRATFSNIEHQAIEVVIDSVSPWVKRFEDEADYKLFGQNRQGLYTKMNMRALMRGDASTRATFYKQMFEMGVFSPNHILKLEDENTLGPDGDKHLVQLNLTTLEHAGEQPAPGAAAAPANDPSADPSPAALARLDALERLFGVAHVE
jgi:HK97 family phage portal protein